ncbi:MAG: YbaN family protein [Rikenellaceae bacterium]
MILKSLYILLGTLSLILGVAGVFTPGLPATPLLLLSAYLYSKGSKKLHRTLLESNFLGRYITSYTKRGGMTLKAKINAIMFMWIMVTISTYFFISNKTMDIAVIVLGCIGTIVMGLVVKRIKD